MTLAEKIVLKMVKKAMNQARKEGCLNAAIKDVAKEQGKNGLTYLIENEVCTPAEIAIALLD